MQNERSYESNVNIKYILEKELSSNKLLIIFSGYSIHPIIKAPYNYRETLKNIKTNKLFISDSYGYDERGCWYLGENGNDLVEKSVISLITFISFKLNIKKKNIILLGSSKGGFASIYYGLKYKFNNILAGAPQILLGDYLSDKENILNSLVNKQKTLKQDAIIGLNSKIMDLNSEKNSKIFIWCGNKDHHLINHIVPFLEKMNTNKSIFLEIFYGDHKDLGTFFQTKLISIVKEVIDNKFPIKISINTLSKFSRIESIDDIDFDFKEIIDIYLDKNFKIITHMPILNKNFEYACYLLDKQTPIIKKFYQKKPSFEFEINYLKNYTLLWYIRDITKSTKLIYYPIKFSIN